MTMPAGKRQYDVAVAAIGDENYNLKAKEIYTICLPEGKATISNGHSKPPLRARSESVPEKEFIEGAWSIIVLLSCAVILMLSQGLAYSVSPLVVEWLETFNQGQAKTGWVGSANIGVMFLTAPLSSAGLKIVGPRALIMMGSLISSVGIFSSAFVPNIYCLYITFSLITGFGFGLLNVTALTLPGFVFDKHKTVALAVVSTGAGVGMLALPYLMHYLIRYYSWRYCMVILSCLTAQGCILATVIGVIKFMPYDKDTNTAAATLADYRKLLKNPSLYFLSLNMFSWNFGGLMAFVFVADMAKHSGLSKVMGAALVSMIGVSSIVTRLLILVVGLYVPLNVFPIYLAGCIIRGTSVLLLPLNSEEGWYSILWCVVCGAGYSMQLGMLVPTYMKVYTPARGAVAFGLSTLSAAAGSLAGPPLAGALYQCFGDYSVSFYIGGAACVSSIIPLAVVWRETHIKERKLTKL